MIFCDTVTGDKYLAMLFRTLGKGDVGAATGHANM